MGEQGSTSRCATSSSCSVSHASAFRACPCFSRDTLWCVLSSTREMRVLIDGQGGGEVLSYACRGSAGSKTLSGVIASSPLVGLTNPKSKLIRYIGGKAAVLMPWFSIPAKVEPEVCIFQHLPLFLSKSPARRSRTTQKPTLQCCKIPSFIRQVL